MIHCQTDRAETVRRVILRPRQVRAERCARAELPRQPMEPGMAVAGRLAQIRVSKYECYQRLCLRAKSRRQLF